MSEHKKTAVRLSVDKIGSLPSLVDSCLKGSNPPDLVLIQLDSKKFPRKMADFPTEVRKYVMTHPRVKVEWDGNRIQDVDQVKMSAAIPPGSVDPGPRYRSKIVATMTSWTKRIGNCYGVVKSVLENTMKPDVIYLNLSLKEFPNREGDLPKNLVELSRRNPKFKINWVPGPNVKPWKKLFPIIDYLDDDDLIILIDDDLRVQKNLIETRVGEFYEYNGKFAISGGGCYPKSHTNLPISNYARYNILSPTSLIQKKMLNGWRKFLDKEMIDTNHDDCLYSMMCMVNGYYIIPSKKISIDRPKNLDVQGLHSMGLCKSNEEVAALFERKFKWVTGKTLKEKLFNLVIWDSYEIAGDNGEALYRRVRELYPDVKMTFLISRNSSDWNRLKEDGFCLYPIDGQYAPVFLNNASYILWTKDTGKKCKELTDTLIKNRDRSVFLQHGVTNKIYNDDFYFLNYIRKFSSYVCCTSEQEAEILNVYSKGSLKTLVVGFPRHDILLHKMKQVSKPSGEKQILVNFHWRRYLQGKDGFLNSEYLRKVNDFLNSDFLKKISEQGVKILFLPHAKYWQYKDYFNVPRYVKIPRNVPFQTILIQSDFLITDFSSNSFEMAYMNKPTITYVPDLSYIQSNDTRYNLKSISSYPHLNMCKTQEQVFEKIQEFLEGGRKFDFTKKIFKYTDDNNTRRLVEWMMKSDK